MARRRSDGQLTERRILDAVVATILDVGYYRASSNEIARRAGVTWGAIQHLFGSRELLMLAVVKDSWTQLEERFAVARIEGETLDARLHCVLDVLASYYEQPAYLAQLQILLDMTADPDVSVETRRTARGRKGQELAYAWRFFSQALGEAASDDELVTFAFTSLRSYLATRVIAQNITGFSEDAELRDLWVESLADAIRKQAAKRGLSVSESLTVR